MAGNSIQLSNVLAVHLDKSVHHLGAFGLGHFGEDALPWCMGWSRPAMPAAGVSRDSTRGLDRAGPPDWTGCSARRPRPTPGGQSILARQQTPAEPAGRPDAARAPGNHIARRRGRSRRLAARATPPSAPASSRCTRSRRIPAVEEVRREPCVWCARPPLGAGQLTCELSPGAGA